MYFTHDNGSRPFLVKVDYFKSEESKPKYGILVTREDPAESKRRFEPSVDTGEQDDKKTDMKHYTQFVLFLRAENVLLGRSDQDENHPPGDDSETVNTLLVETTSLNYTFIGDRIFSFETSEPILALHSPIGNNNVPEPVAESEHFYYFLLDEEWLTKEGFQTTPESNNLYYHYYGYSEVSHSSERGRLLNMKMFDEE
jgi:hypothetical protein